MSLLPTDSPRVRLSTQHPPIFECESAGGSLFAFLCLRPLQAGPGPAPNSWILGSGVDKSHILCVFSCVQPTLFSRLSWGSTDDQCRYRILSARRPLPVDLLRFTNAGQRKIGKIAPKSSKSPLTWVGRRNEVDRNPRYLYATRTVHVKGFARPPGYMRPPNAQAAGSSPP